MKLSFLGGIAVVDFNNEAYFWIAGKGLLKCGNRGKRVFSDWVAGRFKDTYEYVGIIFNIEFDTVCIYPRRKI